MSYNEAFIEKQKLNFLFLESRFYGELVQSKMKSTQLSMQIFTHNLTVVQPVVSEFKHAEIQILPQSNALLLCISHKNRK
jgi:hypothetical protein